MAKYNEIYVNCDGGSRGNPGKAAIGVVVRTDDGTILESVGECIGETTNNVAEYSSLIRALELAAKYTTGQVEVTMDSELVVRQVTGVYHVKKDHLIPLHAEVKKLVAGFESVKFVSVPRGDKYQAQADGMVNAALDGKC